jgi:hypothetical protein
MKLIVLDDYSLWSVHPSVFSFVERHQVNLLLFMMEHAP